MKTTPRARLPHGLFSGQDVPDAAGRYRETAPRERRASPEDIRRVAARRRLERLAEDAELRRLTEWQRSVQPIHAAIHLAVQPPELMLGHSRHASGIPWDDNDNGNGRVTCAEARRHGIAPVHRGHPAYPYMRDGDGVVCE